MGGGPNRIGQGIEFDYCCVQACVALRELGFETIMVNCNPETVSTDYDTADRLYFEPLTLEDVLNVIEAERPEGVIVQFGGQTPINLARGLAEAGAPIWGTPPDAIDLAEDRVRFGELLQRLEIPHPDWGNAQSLDAARARGRAHRLSRCWCGRRMCWAGARMEIAYDERRWRPSWRWRLEASPDGPVLIDHYLEDAFEVDVDALGDGERVVLAGVMQHIEEAGVHSGDSACVLPPYKISQYHLSIMRDYTERLGAGAGRPRIDERAVRHQGRRGVCAGGQPARLAHRAVRQQGHRRAVARLAAQVMAGRTSGGTGFHRDAGGWRLFCQGGRAAVQEIPGRRLCGWDRR